MADHTTGQQGGDDGRGRLFYSCHSVTPFCPVEATTLGYYPNKGANIFFAIAFFLAGLLALGVGTWKKTWSYMAFLTAACFLEVAGYASRVPLADNPWNQDAFQTQIVAIILAPTLLCVSIYLTLKHVTLALSPSLSRVQPRIYPFIFLPADVSCLLVQAIGGALAASASNPPNPELLQGGNRAIIAGIVLQVVVLLSFGVACVDYTVRLRRMLAGSDPEPEAVALWADKKFKMFVYAVTGAYAAVLIRCIYRIAEMAGGWGNHIMQDEPSFMVLDSGMVLTASVLLSAFSPGLLFPQMAVAMNAPSSRAERKKAKNETAATPASGGEESQDVEIGATPLQPQGEPKVLT